MKNKIVLGVLGLAVLGLAGFSATTAFFSTTQTSKANTFTAGNMDVAVAVNRGSGKTRGTSNGVKHNGYWHLDRRTNSETFSVSDLMPGDWGTGVLSFKPTQDAWMCVKGVGRDGDGTMRQNVQIAFWNNTGNNDGVIHNGAERQGSWTTNLQAFTKNGAGYQTLIDSSNGSAIKANKTGQAGYAFCFGEFETNADGTLKTTETGMPICDGASVGNGLQGKTAGADIEFYAEQAKNNPNFVCGMKNVDENAKVAMTDFGTTNGNNGLGVEWNMSNFTHIDGITVELKRDGQHLVTKTASQKTLDAFNVNHVFSLSSQHLGTTFYLDGNYPGSSHWTGGKHNWSWNGGKAGADAPDEAVVTVTQYGKDYVATTSSSLTDSENYFSN